MSCLQWIRRFVLFALTLFNVDHVRAQTVTPEIISQKIEFSGQLLEKGTQKPLVDFRVFLLPQRLQATTDKKGNFEFKDVQATEQMTLIVNASGYLKLEQALLPGMQKVNLFLERLSYNTFETTIVSTKNKRDVSKKSLTQAEFLNLPGAGGDPVKAVQNLPGVSRVAGFSSNVVIQGSAPQDTRYLFEGHEIPLVFHFGGLTSVVMPEAVQEVEYLSAVYGPEYSRALGGVINLKTRDPQTTDREKKSFFFIDNLKTGGLIETQLSENSSLLVSGRYSYIGLFLRSVLKDRTDFNLTVAPEFSDLTVVYKKKLNETDEYKLSFLASRDTLEFLFKEPIKEDPGVRGRFRNETTFFRLVPQWSRKLSTDRLLKFSSSIGKDLIVVDVGNNYFEIDSWVLDLRTEYETKFSADWISQFGMDHKFNDSKVRLDLPYFINSGGVQNPVSVSANRQVDIKAQGYDLGFYWRNEIGEEKDIQYLPHLRFDYFKQTNEFKTSPRFVVKKMYDEDLLIKSGIGLYFQPPRPQETAEDYGNPNVKSPQALHAMIGFEKDFRQGSTQGYQWSAQYFRRDFNQLVISSTATRESNGVQVPEVYNNQGRGRAQGLETQVKLNLDEWSGWVSYTLSESRRWDPSRAEYPFEFDQTHNVNVVASYDWKNNWKFSGRLRYVTGNPSTPVSGAIFDADNDVYIPLRGEFYSQRRKAFQQLDFRFDKKWINNTSIWSLYVDIQNVLNTKNIESEQYSYNYSQRNDVMGLPFLPAFGVKGEF